MIVGTDLDFNGDSVADSVKVSVHYLLHSSSVVDVIGLLPMVER